MLLLALLACDDGAKADGPFALGFGGPPDCVDIVTGGESAPEAFTIELWLRGDPAESDRIQPIVGWTGVFSIEEDASDMVVFGVGDEGGAVYALSLGDGTLHHLAGTFGDGTATLWLDGAKVSFDSGLAPGDAGSGFRVGCSGAGDAYEGIIDEVRLSSVVRYTEGFDRPSGPFEVDDDTIALFHFDEGEGVEVADDASGWTGTADGTEWVEFQLPAGGSTE